MAVQRGQRNTRKREPSPDDAFAREFERADATQRQEMIQSLARYTNRFWLIKRARTISARLRSAEVPFGTLYHFEMSLAKHLHSNRRTHPVANYFIAPYFRERAQPFARDLAELRKRGDLSMHTLAPLLAEMQANEGPEFTFMFIDEFVRHSDLDLAKRAREIERRQMDLKQKPGVAAGQGQPIVEAEFLGFWGKKERDPSAGLDFVLRAEADDRLQAYAPRLRALMEDAEDNAGDVFQVDEVAHPPEPSSGVQDAATESESVADTSTLDSAPFEEEDDQEAEENLEAEEQQADYDQDTIDPNSEFEEDDEDAGPDPLDEWAEELAEEAPTEELEAEPETKSEEDAANAEELRAFLADRRGAVDEWIGPISREVEAAGEEIQGLFAIQDPEERIRKALALKGEQFADPYQLGIKDAIQETDQLFARIMAVLAPMEQKLSAGEMRVVVNNVIESLQSDPRIVSTEPTLIPRLERYRDSIRSRPSDLLEQVHHALRKIADAHSNAAERTRLQVEALEGFLKDEDFRPVWPSIASIYENTINQKLDTKTFQILAKRPADEQWHAYHVMASIHPEGSRAGKAVAKEMSALAKQGMAERLAKEKDGDIPDYDAISSILRQARLKDPVERIGKTLRKSLKLPPLPPATEFDSAAQATALDAIFETPADDRRATVEQTLEEKFAASPREGLAFAAGALTDERMAPLERAAVKSTILDRAQDNEETARLATFIASVDTAPPDQRATRALSFAPLVGKETSGAYSKLAVLEKERAAAPSRLHRALTETDPQRRTVAVKAALADPHVPDSFSGLLRGDPDAFDATMSAIQNGNHAPSHQGQFLKIVSAIAKNKGLLTEERQSALREAMAGTNRAAKELEELTQKNRPLQNYFAREGEAIAARILNGEPAQDVVGMAEIHGEEYENSMRSIKMIDDMGLDDIDSIEDLPAAVQAVVPEHFKQNVDQYIRKRASNRIKTQKVGTKPTASQAKVRPEFTAQLDALGPSPGKAELQNLYKTAQTGGEQQLIKRLHHVQKKSVELGQKREAQKQKLNEHKEKAKQMRRPKTKVVKRSSAKRHRPQTVSAREHAAASKATASAEPVAASAAPSTTPGFSDTLVPATGTDDGFVDGLVAPIPAGGPPADAPADFYATPIAGTEKKSAQQKAHRKHTKTRESSQGADISVDKIAEKSAGFLGKLFSRDESKKNSGKPGKPIKKEDTVSVGKVAKRADKAFFGDQTPKQIVKNVTDQESLLDQIKEMPELKKTESAKRDQVAENIKTAIAVTVMVPEQYRSPGEPTTLCFPRSHWFHDAKRKNLVKQVDEIADKFPPGSQKNQFYKWLVEEMELHYYQRKYKSSRLG